VKNAETATNNTALATTSTATTATGRFSEVF